MPLLWQLQVFDRAGNTIGTLSKPPGGPIFMVGSPDAFALCIPDMLKVPAFFIGSLDNSRATYHPRLPDIYDRQDSVFRSPSHPAKQPGPFPCH